MAREFKGRIAFLGGVDVQRILPYGTPEEVRAEVHRVRRLLEPQLIISPSHEKVLPDVPRRILSAGECGERAALGIDLFFQGWEEW